MRRTLQKFIAQITSIWMIPSALALQPHPSQVRDATMIKKTLSRYAATLDTLKFDNLAVRSLPIDFEEKNYVRPSVPNVCFSKVSPAPVLNPKLVAFSSSALNLLDISTEEVKRQDAPDYFSGNKLFPGSSPGAGPTPYSRRADGRKVLRSTIREFLCSEAMHHLGIPSTRAGTMVTSDTMVMRDLFYTGDIVQEKASIVLRIAPTFLRFGSFEIFKPTDPYTGRTGPSANNIELLKTMLRYSIGTFFPDASKILDNTGSLKDATCAMFEDVIRRTAELVAMWQCVGFTHGVLNTDNMSILGLTIDYGPYGFMEYFDWDYVPNGSDNSGRYRYREQPEICKWNLKKFGEALHPVLSSEDAESLLVQYHQIYSGFYNNRMAKKLGISFSGDSDEKLFSDLFNTMAATSADFTSTFRILIDFAKGLRGEADIEQTSLRLSNICAAPEVLMKIIDRARRIGRPGLPAERLLSLWAMIQSNPEEVSARFGTSKEALISELEGEMKKHEEAQAAGQRAAQMKNVSIQEKREDDSKEWTKWLRMYAGRLNGSSADVEVMAMYNPSYILRNWKAQLVIDEAESGNFELVQRELDLLTAPFKEELTSTIDEMRPPEWAPEHLCTCSS